MRKKEMKETTGEFILQKSKEYRVARFYCNWKCHKYAPTQCEFANAAVRGIVSCTGTADEKVCDYLDFILNPGMQNLRSYLKGTKDFLLWVEKLKQQYPELPPLFSILTMDFKQMYPSMPDGLVMPAVREYLNSRQVQTPSTEETLKLLEIVRNNNFMEFGNKIFQQVGGTSIGKKHAPPLACLGAGRLEKETIYPSEKFQSLVLDDKENTNEEDRFFKRFIDDIIAAMEGTRDDAQKLVDWMNTLWAGIEFTFEWSDKELTYLDVNLIMTEGKLKQIDT